MAHLQSYFEPVVARTMVSTTLAKGIVKTPFEGIPPAFCKYKKVFLDKKAQWLPKHQPWDHKIDLVPGQQMGKTSVYRLTPPEKLALKDYIKDGLKQGTLRCSEAPNAWSFFFINKKDGKLCLVQDYCPLNAITRKNVAPIPLIPKLIDKLLGARFFAKLDVWWGYNNIRIREGDEWKTTFKTPMGLYESLVMNFGLYNALATFQTFMDEQFKDLIATGHVVVYLYDILIFADNEAELEQLTHKVLQCLLDLDLFLRLEKCSFNKTAVKYLSIIISEGELCIDPVKLTAVKQWPRPKTVKDIQKFLGFCNFYCRFVKAYCYRLPHVTVFWTKDQLHLQHILYKGFYTSNWMYVPFRAVSENIQKIFCVTTSPLQSLLIPCLWSPSSDSKTTVPSLLMELWDKWELPSGGSANTWTVDEPTVL